MAWLDDSPVRKVGKFLEWKNAPVGRQLQENRERWQIVHQLPLIKMLARYFSSLFVHRKLNSLEQKIKSFSADNISSVLPLLKDLMQLKKRIPKVNSPMQAFDRVRSLRSALIRKSHDMLSLQEESHRKAEQPQKVSNSHNTILNLIKPFEDKAPVPQFIPSKVYWRHADSGHPSVETNARPSTVHLHTCVTTLFSLLKNPTTHLSPLGSDIIVSFHDDLAHANPALVCGVGFKFNQVSSNKRQASFWQNQSTLAILPKLKGENISKHIDKLFFQTSGHLEQFKDLLYQHQETHLLEMISNLENRAQIKIHQNTPLAMP